MESILLTKASPNLKVGNLDLGSWIWESFCQRNLKVGSLNLGKLLSALCADKNFPKLSNYIFSSLQNSECYSGNICPCSVFNLKNTIAGSLFSNSIFCEFNCVKMKRQISYVYVSFVITKKPPWSYIYPPEYNFFWYLHMA